MHSLVCQRQNISSLSHCRSIFVKNLPPILVLPVISHPIALWDSYTSPNTHCMAKCNNIILSYLRYAISLVGMTSRHTSFERAMNHYAKPADNTQIDLLFTNSFRKFSIKLSKTQSLFDERSFDPEDFCCESRRCADQSSVNTLLLKTSHKNLMNAS